MNNVFQNIKKMREMRNYKQEYMAQRLNMSLR
jgi:DNA-binding XRE family transcriptional regulator